MALLTMKKSLEPTKDLICKPKYIRDIEKKVGNVIKTIKVNNSEILELQQLYNDKIFQVYQEAFNEFISKSITSSDLLRSIKTAYENAIAVRTKRIEQYITQDRVFGITSKKYEEEKRVTTLLQENESLKEQNLKLFLQVSKLQKDLGKRVDDKSSNHLLLMKERDARYKLYFENLELHLKLKGFDGSAQRTSEVAGDTVILRIALDKCREQLSITQRDLKRMTDEYADTVPRREYDILESKHYEVVKSYEQLNIDHQALEGKLRKVQNQQINVEEELRGARDRCESLERTGTPRPQWELCADFITGGRTRWRELARGLSSRDALRALLKELGPAGHGDTLEHFDGLGLDPMIPPYLQYEGKVRNLRLSRREIAIIINDIWTGKIDNGQAMTMEEYVTKYFEDRYHQPSVRAEWAYNLCSGAEQILDEPQVKLFWGVLHGHLSERIYTCHRQQYYNLKDNVYSKGAENITMEEFERISKATFPLKNEVDIKNMTDVVRRQLKLKINNNEVNVDKLFQENEEGFDRVELARELYRQRQLAQDKYIRELVAELGGKQGPNKMITVDNLKRAFVIVDPAIDHIRMEMNVRWVFSEHTADLSTLGPLPLRVVAARLAAGDVERVALRNKPLRRHR